MRQKEVEKCGALYHRITLRYSPQKSPAAIFYQYIREPRSNIQMQTLKRCNEDQHRPETSMRFAGHHIKFNYAAAGGRLTYP